MPWRDGLSEDQIIAAGHIGTHACLLAGPGTGKTRTLTRRVLALVLSHGIESGEILALTFTRVAAFQLREKLKEILEPLNMEVPRVSTLHSFALRQLLRNANRIEALPSPLRIADDWEERFIIQEDLKAVLERSHIREIQDLFQRLSADWETLMRDQPTWEEMFPDAAFLGAWRDHRRIYGYTLRAELVYQLRRALNQYQDLSLEDNYQNVLVDEYQDLNACDLDVIMELSKRGSEIFVAGDDDQSIYGFRYAYPEGIRRFSDYYDPCNILSLETCYRCDRSILRISEFVANLDPRRLRKTTIARQMATEGEVHLLEFTNQYHEARGLAQICHYLIQSEGVVPNNILILLRNDRNNALSSVLKGEFINQGVPVAENAELNPLEMDEGRLVLGILHLLVDPEDSLSWRTTLMMKTGIGEATCKAVNDLAGQRGIRFSAALFAIKDDPGILARFGTRIASVVNEYEELLERLSRLDIPLVELIQRTTQIVVSDDSIREDIRAYLRTVIETTEASSLNDLIAALNISLDSAEQELIEGAVNILTMHKAKGLSADVVFIAAAEDEFIPGRNEGEREGDERRLLFVSMTRARHALYISYCDQRVYQQRHLGRTSGDPHRLLTRFLRDAPIRVENGNRFISGLVH